MLEIICMPMIVALVYAIIELYKKTINGAKHAILAKLIPIIACVLGIAAGIICYYCFPELIAAHNLATAILIGAASGLSATGCNQIFKQLKLYGIEVKEPNQENTTQLNSQDTTQQEKLLNESALQEIENSKSETIQIEKENEEITNLQNNEVQNEDKNQ